MDETTKRDTYRGVRERLTALLEGEDDFIAAQATVVCELHHAFDYFDWTGFYRTRGADLLVIGPYQGTDGCLRIPFSRGVCGAAARSKQTQRIADVSQFAGHIACSSSTQSEIVVPLVTPAGVVLGVLDVDSNTPAAFSALDQTELEALCADLVARFASQGKPGRVSSPRALPPPSGPVCWISEDLLEGAIAVSQSSPRRRVIQPFHRDEQATLHRMFNAVQPDSYIPPHRHADPPKVESWVVLRGALAFFTFDASGRVEECLEIRAGGPVFGVDLEPGVYHTFIALEPDSVVFEVKSGPYSPANDKAFPDWAPAEGSDKAGAYMAWLKAVFTQRSATLATLDDAAAADSDGRAHLKSPVV